MNRCELSVQVIPQRVRVTVLHVVADNVDLSLHIGQNIDLLADVIEDRPILFPAVLAPALPPDADNDRGNAGYCGEDAGQADDE